MNLEIKDLHKAFGPVKVLKGVNLKIQDQGIVAILGPNGSGKTTLIKCILGMVIPDAGQIFIDEKDIKGKWEYRDQLDYLSQIADFPSNLRVLELIEMMKHLRPKTSSEKELIELFNLGPHLNKKLGQLSGGTKQKVNLVLTFMFDSDLIILDEPTSGLDPISLIHLEELIEREKSKGKTILITSHIMSFVESVAERIIFLLEGDIYFNGTVKGLKEQTGQEDLNHAIAHLLKEQHV